MCSMKGIDLTNDDDNADKAVIASLKREMRTREEEMTTMKEEMTTMEEEIRKLTS